MKIQKKIPKKMDKEHLNFSGPSKGKITKLAEIDVYTIGDGPKVFIFLYDIFGLFVTRARQICDQISSFGYTVVLPDILKGEYWKESVPFGTQLSKWLSQINYNLLLESKKFREEALPILL